MGENLGRIAARKAYGDEGPDLNVTWTDVEKLAVDVQRAFAKGLCEEATRRQAERLGETVPCPACGEECDLERPERAPEEKAIQKRPIQTRSGPFDLAEPRGRGRRCRRFFPLSG